MEENTSEMSAVSSVMLQAESASPLRRTRQEEVMMEEMEEMQEMEEMEEMEEMQDDGEDDMERKRRRLGEKDTCAESTQEAEYVKMIWTKYGLRPGMLIAVMWDDGSPKACSIVEVWGTCGSFEPDKVKCRILLKTSSTPMIVALADEVARGATLMQATNFAWWLSQRVFTHYNVKTLYAMDTKEMAKPGLKQLGFDHTKDTYMRQLRSDTLAALAADSSIGYDNVYCGKRPEMVVNDFSFYSFQPSEFKKGPPMIRITSSPPPAAAAAAPATVASATPVGRAPLPQSGILGMNEPTTDEVVGGDSLDTYAVGTREIPSLGFERYGASSTKHTTEDCDIEVYRDVVLTNIDITPKSRKAVQQAVAEFESGQIGRASMEERLRRAVSPSAVCAAALVAQLVSSAQPRPSANCYVQDKSDCGVVFFDQNGRPIDICSKTDLTTARVFSSEVRRLTTGLLYVDHTFTDVEARRRLLDARDAYARKDATAAEFLFTVRDTAGEKRLHKLLEIDAPIASVGLEKQPAIAITWSELYIRLVAANVLSKTQLDVVTELILEFYDGDQRVDTRTMLASMRNVCGASNLNSIWRETIRRKQQRVAARSRAAAAPPAASERDTQVAQESAAPPAASERDTQVAQEGAAPPAASERDTHVAQESTDNLFDELAEWKDVSGRVSPGRLQIKKVEERVQILWTKENATISEKKVHATDVTGVKVTTYMTQRAWLLVVAKNDVKYLFNFYWEGLDFKVRPYQPSAPLGPQPPPPLAFSGVVVRRRSATRRRAASKTSSSLTWPLATVRSPPLRPPPPRPPLRSPARPKCQRVPSWKGRPSTGVQRFATLSTQRTMTSSTSRPSLAFMRFGEEPV